MEDSHAFPEMIYSQKLHAFVFPDKCIYMLDGCIFVLLVTLVMLSGPTAGSNSCAKLRYGPPSTQKHTLRGSHTNARLECKHTNPSV